MRVATVDGLFTLFYDGSKELWNERLSGEWHNVYTFHRLLNSDRHFKEDDINSWDLSDECKSYIRERLSWQQIIVVDGVTEIPYLGFTGCFNIKRVILADTVIRIANCAFCDCKSLIYIKWSISLEFIGHSAFKNCNLSSVFIPPRCREIVECAFEGNTNLAIFNISQDQDTQLGNFVVRSTKLLESCPNSNSEAAINTWIKNINHDEKFTLHRACASFNPLKEVILAIIQEKGLKAFREENSIGITPSRYLKENPYAEVTEKAIIEDYILQMMGER